MKTVRVPAGVRDAMIVHSLREQPDECCGLLLGRQAIERVVPMRSDPPSPDTYYMDPEQQIAVFTDMESRGEQLLGIYHSHPRGPTEPSGMDLQLAFHPGVFYFIISLADPDRPEVEAYLLQDGMFEKVEICCCS